MRIELRDVSATHGRRPALAGVSLSILSGELCALLGPSGAGKSTLLAVLAGLHPARGEILLDGARANGLDPRRRGLGMVFQDLALWPHLGVAEHLRFVLDAAGVTRAEQAARIAEILGVLELAPLAARLPAQLSGGEAQRLALARALVARPRALLLDEPLGALDRVLRERMLAYLRDVHARYRTTTLLVTHDPDEALALAERVAVLAAGRILQAGTSEEVYRRPVSARVAELTGAASVVPARRTGSDVMLPWGPARAELASGAGDEVAVILRPEQVEVVPRASGPGRLRATRFQGGRWLAEVELGACRVTGWSARRLADHEAVAVRLTEPVWAVEA